MGTTQSGELFVRALEATGLSYAQLGRLIGVSAKTIQRTVAGRSHPIPLHLNRLAALVHPNNRALAVRIATAAGTTLEALGLEKPPPPPPAPPPPKVEPPRAPEPVRPPLTASLAETVLCAAAEAMDLSPRAIRPALAAAFSRAHELGYTIPDLARVFGGPTKPSKG